MSNKLSNIILLMGCFIALIIMPVEAKVSKQEAESLKTTLTPLGAERAGNASGTIPMWEGGLKSVPTGLGYKGSGSPYLDPYAQDKVLFSITAQNLDKYADKLTPGVKELFKRYPKTFRIDVYPTRRTQAAPDWVYENTYKNALNAEISSDGNSINGAYGGIPFPIPQNGSEVIWNHLLMWSGSSRYYDTMSYLVAQNGMISNGAGGPVWYLFPYYKKDGSVEDFGGYYQYMFMVYSNPARRKGEVLLTKDPVNLTNDSRKAWQYLVGQRRVRRAPTVAYDTPNSTFSGQLTYDDTFMFNGGPDRYDWKIIEKKELYIPYNCYKVDLEQDIKKRFVENHPNCDYLRWELHRVWVIEATLKDGARHVYHKRRFAFDEDSWLIVLADNYDAQGNLWRTAMTSPKNEYDLPGVCIGECIGFDFQTGDYSVQLHVGQSGKGIDHSIVKDESFFTPENIRKQGIR